MSCRRELGQLSERIADFGRRGVEVWAIAASPVADAQELTRRFPGIRFLADPRLEAISRFGVRHPGGAFPAADRSRVIAYPTTFLVDETAVVRWIFRSGWIMERVSADALLAVVDRIAWTGP